MRSSPQRRHSALVEQQQHGPDRAKGAVALALVELDLGQLDVARRDVVDDGYAGQEIAEVLPGRPSTGAVDVTADHQPKLDLVVEQPDMGGADDVVVARRRSTKAALVKIVLKAILSGSMPDSRTWLA